MCEPTREGICDCYDDKDYSIHCLCGVCGKCGRKVRK